MFYVVVLRIIPYIVALRVVNSVTPVSKISYIYIFETNSREKKQMRYRKQKTGTQLKCS